MKFHLYHLFYWLAILILVGGFYLIGYQIQAYDVIVVPGWHSTIFVNFWWTLPLAAYSLIIGLIYSYCYIKGKNISKTITIFHFILTVVGLLISINNLPSIILLLSSKNYLTGLSLSNGDILLFFMGPIILFLSLIIFVISILRAKPINNKGTNVFL